MRAYARLLPDTVLVRPQLIGHTVIKTQITHQHACLFICVNKAPSLPSHNTHIMIFYSYVTTEYYSSSLLHGVDSKACSDLTSFHIFHGLLQNRQPFCSNCSTRCGVLSAATLSQRLIQPCLRSSTSFFTNINFSFFLTSYFLIRSGLVVFDRSLSLLYRSYFITSLPLHV